jgi:hypothetical protein
MRLLVSSGVSSASGRALAYLKQNRAGLRPRRCGRLATPPRLALDGTTPVPTARSWPGALAERSRAPLEFDPMPSSIRWVLFSSGTTGLP